MSSEDFLKAAIIHAAGRIAAAYITAHKPTIDALPELMDHITQSLGVLNSPTFSSGYEQPHTDISSSVTSEYIVCLEDGKKLKMLKRYLKTNFNMTPEEYRRKWNLPPDYPMVAPNYAKRRSELAKDIGLGKQSLHHRKQVAVAKFKSGLPTGKGKLQIVRSTDIMTARSPHNNH
ncbi:MAG: transcriptional regulator [Alphaproteobacteria bacterium]|nr:MAG: transcriptional regulator [Alphaproteobacteria bacterium]TAF14209.1 MAG: transcriptional regulator [Alphaproteobacteria bacterium]TAF39331.1 MAG: transcriptional regulator [Alphaproteobacteria bacterium]TAF76918.1 MAG: transcriptional regulator [Alphaproteobacteria bacterium]